MKFFSRKIGFVFEIIIGILLVFTCFAFQIIFPIIEEEVLTFYSLPEACSIIALSSGILLITLGIVNYRSFKRDAVLASRKHKFTTVATFVILGTLEVCGILIADLGGNEIINNFYYWDFHLQPIIANLFLIFFIGISIILMTVPLLYIIKLSIHVKKKKHMKIVKPLRVSASLVSLMAIIFGAGTGIFFIVYPLPCSFSTIGFQEPAYALPTGAHINTDLDTLSAGNKTLLDALEEGLWAMTRVQQGGGFSMYVTPDGSKYYGDRIKGCPYGPGEFCMQMSTPYIARVYLRMYQLEPNPVYLQVARDAADALLKVQDNVNGGFYYDGIVNADGTAVQPHPLNIRRAALLDDNVMQSCLEFLIDIYEETNDSRYLAAIQRGFDCIDAMETPIGGWRQRSNYALEAYPSLVTLNDGALRDTFYLYLKAYDFFNDTRYLNAATRAAQFLLDVQGNGGSSLQQGWAQQYTWEGMPEWGRHFEPPGMCSTTTSGAIRVLIEMYLRTNDTKWINTIPDAIAWLEDPSSDVGGKYSRIYELQTNRPIYGIKAGGGKGRNPEYSYNIEDAGEGYGWVDYFGVSGAIGWYNYLNVTLGFDVTLGRQYLETPPSNATLLSRALSANGSQISSGFWLDWNGEYIRDYNFYNHTGNLISYLDRQVNG
ncbi:MAG: pectate lyase [Candidatus Hodarchaeota archaeon]